MVSIGKFFLVIGLIFLILGLIMVSGHRISFLGKLPGDIHIEKPNFRFYFPVITCILLSLIFTLLFWFFRR